MKRKVTASLMTAFSALLSVPHFLIVVQLSVLAVKLYSGLASFAGLFSLLPLAIAELAFVIGIGSYYSGARDNRRLTRRFLAVTSVQLLLFPTLEAVRFLLLLPAVRGRLSLYLATRSPLEIGAAAAGILLGATGLVLAGWIRRGQRSRP